MIGFSIAKAYILSAEILDKVNLRSGSSGIQILMDEGV